jgi:hypothetical protein
MIQLFYGLAALACPVGMGLMMWMMMRGNRNNASGNAGVAPGVPAPLESQQQMAQLRAEIDQLKAERAARGEDR